MRKLPNRSRKENAKNRRLKKKLRRFARLRKRSRLKPRQLNHRMVRVKLPKRMMPKRKPKKL